jgi:ribosomal protein RSM22 (predicted rRNA methylase)
VETWSDIAMVTMIDTNPTFLDIGRRLTAASGHDALARTESRRRDILAIADELAADLVVASFALTELALHQEAATRLWRVTGGVLVVIEPGTPAGFACIRAVRKTLIAQGARVVAPCPHDEACPIVAPDWCHFVQRLGRSRDHRLVKAATAPFEDEKFSYVALARSGLAVARPAARVLSRPRIGKADIRLKLCAPGGLVERLVRRRDRVAYAGLRRIRWGDAIDDR